MGARKNYVKKNESKTALRLTLSAVCCCTDCCFVSIFYSTLQLPLQKCTFGMYLCTTGSKIAPIHYIYARHRVVDASYVGWWSNVAPLMLSQLCQYIRVFRGKFRPLRSQWLLTENVWSSNIQSKHNFQQKVHIHSGSWFCNIYISTRTIIFKIQYTIYTVAGARSTGEIPV